jgi:hypothetical protein
MRRLSDADRRRRRDVRSANETQRVSMLLVGAQREGSHVPPSRPCAALASQVAFTDALFPKQAPSRACCRPSPRTMRRYGRLHRGSGLPSNIVHGILFVGTDRENGRLRELDALGEERLQLRRRF